MERDTGFPRVDAEHDFLRVRRHQVLSRLAAWMRRDLDEVVQSLSFDEVVAALGPRGETFAGLDVIPLDAIVGSVDKVRDFDHRFRPTSGRSRARWERLAEAARRGEAFPPIDVYRLGDLYFVRDGHHRVSVARAQGLTKMEAYVTNVHTVLSSGNITRRADLERKEYRRIFLERVPLTGAARASTRIQDPWKYAILAEMVEAWATRRMHSEGAYIDKDTMARRWFDEEYLPVIGLIEEAGLIDEDETGPEAYLRLSGDRYRLIRTHTWNEDVVQTLRQRSKKATTT